jgi:hypothetical protein
MFTSKLPNDLPDLSQSDEYKKQILLKVFEIQKQLDLSDIMLMKNNPDKMFETLQRILDEKYEQITKKVLGDTIT